MPTRRTVAAATAAKLSRRRATPATRNLAYYTAYLLATDAIKAEEGQQFTAGRLGHYTITKDPTRPHGLRVVLGPLHVYDKTNIGATE